MARNTTERSQLKNGAVIHRRQLTLESGNSGTIRSRLVPITNTWNLTIWEWDKPSNVMEHYWASQQNVFSRMHLLDPFGLVSWPGSVVATRLLHRYKSEIENSTVLILGAGPGVEAQAAAMLGARHVIATDIHPTTLQLLRYGAQEAGLDGIIQEQVLDVCSDVPLPQCDVMVAADVLYNEHLALHMGRRCLEAVQKGVKVLVTDSQRFTDLLPDLSRRLDAEPPMQWNETRLDAFTGSGVMVDEDQTYSVTVRVLGIGWESC
jgi:predicted nicotinamide N-methyase